MTIADSTVVSAPVVHDIVSGLECTLTGTSGSKPGTRPCRIGSLHQSIGYFLRKLYSPSFCDLQNRTQTLHQIQSDHGNRHLRTGGKVAGESAAAEVVKAGFAPYGCICHLLDIFIGNFPPLLHDSVTILILTLTAGIQTSCTGVQKVNDTTILFCLTFQIITCHTLGSFR